MLTDAPIEPQRTPSFDLNCDLGEGETPTRTAALLSWVDSTSIACGGHAGDDASMRGCLELGKSHGVRVGAHPGLPARGDFGRGPVGRMDAVQLRTLLREQVGRLAEHAERAGVPLHHVKLHGTLYHVVDADPGLTQAYLDCVAGNWPGLRVYARAEGGVVAAARHRATTPEVWAEGFLDRGYRADATLVPRHEAGAMLPGTEAVLTRLADLRERRGCRTVDGEWVNLRVRTLCVHGDNPAALSLLEGVRRVMPRRRGD